jgi:hypothetical protein
MVEREFETALERMFAQGAPMSDTVAFTQRVEARLNRNWRWRTLAIGFAGAVGGGIALTQSIGSGFTGRVQAAGTASANAFDTMYHQVSGGGSALLQMGSGIGMFWIASGLMILAAIVGASKALDES